LDFFLTAQEKTPTSGGMILAPLFRKLGHAPPFWESPGGVENQAEARQDKIISRKIRSVLIPA
jgi:hypothetical protein